MLKGLFTELDPRPLGMARVMVGAAAVIRAVVAWPIFYELAQPETLRIPYAEWTPDPSLSLVVVLVVVWGLSALLFVLGWHVQIFGSLLAASLVATLVIDQQTYSNHLYLMCWLVVLLTIAGSGHGLSINREDRPVTRWPVLLIMIQLSVVYGFSAVTKMNAGFLSGAVLAGTLGTGLIPFPDALRTPPVMSVMAALAVLVELFIAFFIWRPRFRPTAFVLGLGLHVSILLWMDGTEQLFVFTLEMLALYPLFLPEKPLVVRSSTGSDRFRRWLPRVRRLDLLHAVSFLQESPPDEMRGPRKSSPSLEAIGEGDAVQGFPAMTRILERIVPTLWFAPVLRLPGISHLGAIWFRRKERIL